MLAALVAVIFAATAIGCAETGGSKDFRADTHPFEFNYPADWTLSQARSTRQGDTSIPGTVTVALREPFDQVQLKTDRLAEPIPAGERANRSELDRIVEHAARRTAARASSGKRVEYDSGAGVQYAIEYPERKTVQLRSRMTFLFRDDWLLQVNCQSTRGKRQSVLEGCKQILESLRWR